MDQFRLVGLTQDIYDFLARLAHDTSSIAAGVIDQTTGTLLTRAVNTGHQVAFFKQALDSFNANRQ